MQIANAKWGKKLKIIKMERWMYTITLKAEIRDMTLEHPKLDLYMNKVLYKVNQQDCL